MINAPTSSPTPLSTLSARLRDIQGLVAQRRTAPSSTPAIDNARRTAAAIAHQVEQVGAFGSPVPFRTVGFRVEAPDVHTIASVRGSAKHPEPPEFDVTIDVTASAQIAGFVLSLGGPNINLGGRGQYDGASSQFVLDIGGPLDTRQLSFASGTALSDMEAQINSFTDVTGVHAALSGDSTLRLESTGVGSDQFVSVKVVDDGGISGSGGIYAFDPQNTNAADLNTAPIAFYAAANPLTDHGQDVAATVNGKTAVGHARSLSVSTTRYSFTMDLTQAASQKLGSRYAFRFHAGRPRVQAEPQPSGVTPLLPDTYA